MSVTIKDVAKDAGVSVTTASVVLRNAVGVPVKANTREIVLESAKRLGYHYNKHARILRGGAPKTIGLLMRDMEILPGRSKLRAVDQLVSARGYDAMMRGYRTTVEQEKHHIQEYLDNNVQGLIAIQGSIPYSGENLKPIVEAGIPIVTLEPLQGLAVDCVTVDRQYGTYTLAKHLWDLGHRRIGLIITSLSIPSDLERMLGYHQLLTEHNVSLDHTLITEMGMPRNTLSHWRGYDIAKAILAQRNGATAIICSNDEVAIGALKAIYEEGLSVPDDLAIVGFDNMEIAEFARVPITSMAQPIDEIARLAVELLFRRIESPGEELPPQFIKVQPELVIRQSCGQTKAKVGSIDHLVRQ